MRRPALLAIVLAAALAAGSMSFSGAAFTTATSNGANRAGAAIDWTAPEVALADPGSWLPATTVLTATASDSRTAVASVAIAYAPSGTGIWTEICTRTAAPYTCTLATGPLPGGRYDLRASAIDVKGNRGTSAVLTGRLVDREAPTVDLADPGIWVRGTVTLTATGTDTGSGIGSVRIQRSLADAEAWTDVCTVQTAAASCSWATAGLANDFYDLRAVATDRAGNVSTADLVEGVLVDNLAPTVTMTNPGSPIRGTVTLGATVGDAHSGVASLTVQISRTGTGTWSTACTTTVTPWTCRFDTTTLPDAGYDLRAIATDAAGNTATSTAVTNRLIDNAQSSISMEDPGASLTGIVTLRATPFSRAGITSVKIQRAVAGSTTWVDVCTVTAAPHSCTWDSRTVADGLYDFRAVLVDGSAKTTISAVVSARRVDNTPLRGTDVQTTNATGATNGRLDAGDTIAFTYSKVLQPTSLIAGWNGSGIAVAVRVRDGGLLGLGTLDDTLDVFTTTTLQKAVNVGSVNLRGDFVKGGKNAVYNTTAVLETTTVGGVPVSRLVLTLGTMASGAVRTSGSNANMVWTPSAAATDLAGNPASTTPITETGTVDKDF